MNSYDKPPPYSPPECTEQPQAPTAPVVAPNNYATPPPYYPPASTVVYPSGYQTAPVNPYENRGPPQIIYTGPPQYGTVPIPSNTVGCCPACRVGYLVEDYPCIGICLALFCFPCGICCCLAMKRRRCPYCGASYK
ncbi:brain protein I3-like [Uloborus diversus]|uniref:brain protein I3-like n=1 Tax=Uloborus diversus TaxID=327109 RepID=UPI002408FAC4|nr:brain protein I3-like [Uloborus diversus]XP_054714253.1 brain protein I3-like [Uloborus diversus]